MSKLTYLWLCGEYKTTQTHRGDDFNVFNQVSSLTKKAHNLLFPPLLKFPPDRLSFPFLWPSRSLFLLAIIFNVSQKRLHCQCFRFCSFSTQGRKKMLSEFFFPWIETIAHHLQKLGRLTHFVILSMCGGMKNSLI